MNQEQNFQKDFSLTREERIKMRRTVYQYMEMKPRRAAFYAGAPSAWNFRIFYSPRAIAAAVVVALFASSAGVSLAAQNTLPGDLLYPVKTDITEPVEGALATSASAKAAWAASVAGERVSEAATLAAEGRLSTSTQEELATNFNAHADIAIDTIAAEASTSPDVGAQAATQFGAQLSEDQQVLADLASNSTASSSPLFASLSAKQQRLAMIGMRIEAHFAETNNAATSTAGNAIAAAHMRTAAAAQLRTSSALAQQAGGSLNASSSRQVQLDIQSASSTISAGEALLQNNAAPQAYTSFQKALAAAEQLGVFLQTSSAIHARTGLVIGQPTASTSSSTSERIEGTHHMHSRTVTAASSSAATNAGIENTSTTTSSSVENERPSPSSVSEQSESSVQPAVSVPIAVPSLP